METTDFLIIGGGVMGIALALELARRHPQARLVLLEKEKEVALHASGRNSGVLHAGFYYTADSLKARFTRDGNRKMTTWCEERGLKINKCGKLVVCKDESELAGLKELARRGQANGVNLEWISASEAREIEPHILTREAALWSPDTASVDPVEVVHSLAGEARAAGIDIRTGTAFTGCQKQSGGGWQVHTRQNRIRGEIEAGYVVNCAGLQADQIASQFGFARHHRILPFKGLYLYAGQQAYRPRVHIYPVPDLQHPFLGVHFTLTVDGQAKIGPTAMPAFWRENYQGLQGFDALETAEILWREARLWLGNSFGFRQLAWQEMQKYRKSFMVNEAAAMLHGAQQMDFARWGRPGIRAQLVDMRENRLEMDFIHESDEHSFHLLNAVSPAFTCALSLAPWLTDIIDGDS